jgi:uncharacterized protein (TIGR02679 family)
MADRARLERLLGGPALAGLRARLRRRYELGGARGTLTLSALGEVERDALCGMLGRPTGRGASLRFSLDDVDAVLARAGVAPSLRAALEILDGPIEDRAAQRLASARAWEELQEGVRDPRLKEWLAHARGLGMLKRTSGSDPGRAQELCIQAERVLAVLPSSPTTRSRLAAQALGDAHALDRGLPLPALVLAALRHARADEEMEEDESQRAQWAACGVMVNELARPALALNLPGAGMPGDPCYLSLRSLLRQARAWPVARRDIHVCENPNVVAIAADALGERCAPLVCTDGMPAAAQRTLLSQLATAGASFLYHGDFDWPGIAIGNVVMREWEALPWRFKSQDYMEAVSTAAGGRMLDATERQAVWDPVLVSVMQKRGIAIDEEAVIDLLIRDLDQDAK